MRSIYYDFIDTCLLQFKKHRWIYITSIFFVVAGILVGVCLALRGETGSSILSFSDKHYLSYLKGSANLHQIFLSNMKNILLASIIVFASSMSVFSVWIGLIYIAYQSVLMILTMGSLVFEFGASGAINSVLLVFPFNLVIMLVLCLILCMGYGFFRTNTKTNSGLFSLNHDKYIVAKVLFAIVAEIAVCIILSFIVPFVLKNCIIVAY